MSQVLWQHLGHLPQGNNEFQTTSIHQKSTWVKYRDIQTIDEHKLLGLLHLNEKKKKKGDSQPLQEAVRSCVSEKAEVDRLCESRGGLSCGRHCRSKPGLKAHL